MNTHETEIRQPARTHKGFLSTVPCLAEQTVDSETEVKEMIPKRSEVRDIVSGQHVDKAQTLTVESSQPTSFLLDQNEGGVPDLPAGARSGSSHERNEVTTFQQWVDPHDLPLVRELTACGETMHGARSSCGNIAASTWIGASTSQLLEFGCYPTGVEPLSRNDKLILADNHVESNAESSISESVHGPVGAGTNCGTTHDGSTHSSDNQLTSITDLETKRFRDAGDMRSEADGNCSNVNSYLMETSVAPEVKIFKGSQSIEIHRMSMSAQLDGSNDQRTHGIRIDGSGRAAIPYCQLSSSCGSQLSRAIGGGWTGSSSARGTGPPEQVVYLVEQDKLLSERERWTLLSYQDWEAHGQSLDSTHSANGVQQCEMLHEQMVLK